MIGTTQEFLADTEQKVDETAKAVLGSLAEEASSEIVQKELEAMSKAITDAADNLMERVLRVCSFPSAERTGLRSCGDWQRYIQRRAQHHPGKLTQDQ